jgi:hypothetical protein
MGQPSAEPVTFHCAEPGCDQQVSYERQEHLLPGVAYERAGGGKPQWVYLECPAGHVHRYQVGG